MRHGNIRATYGFNLSLCSVSKTRLRAFGHKGKQKYGIQSVCLNFILLSDNVAYVVL